MAISDFQNFDFLTPKISKNTFSDFFLHKIKNFQNFQKNGIYVRKPPISNHHAKFRSNISIFSLPITTKSMPPYDVIFLKFVFGAFSDTVGKQKWHHSVPGTKLVHNRVFFSQIFIFSSLTFFDLTLTGPALKGGQRMKWTLPSSSTSETSRKTCITRHIAHGDLVDLTLTLTCT